MEGGKNEKDRKQCVCEGMRERGYHTVRGKEQLWEKEGIKGDRGGSETKSSGESNKDKEWEQEGGGTGDIIKRSKRELYKYKRNERISED